MSSSKRFEKTFSRKKKENNKSDEREKGLEEEEEEEQVLSTLAAKSRKLKTSKNHTSNGETPETAKQPKASKTHTNNGEKPETAKKGGERPSKKTTSRQKIENVGTSSQNQSKQSPEKQQTQKHKRKVEHGEGESKREKVKKKKEEENATPTKKNTKNQKEGKEDEESFECTFATNRIVRIIKSEGADYRLSAEAVFLINKATEKFIELFAEDAYDCAVQERKSFIAYKHLSTAVSQEKRFDFLSDFVPEKVTAEKALAERKPAETSPV